MLSAPLVKISCALAGTQQGFRLHWTAQPSSAEPSSAEGRLWGLAAGRPRVRCLRCIEVLRFGGCYKLQAVSRDAGEGDTRAAPGTQGDQAHKQQDDPGTGLPPHRRQLLPACRVCAHGLQVHIFTRFGEFAALQALWLCSLEQYWHCARCAPVRREMGRLSACTAC